MARFYGDVQGNRGEATRMGTPSSGISAHISRELRGACQAVVGHTPRASGGVESVFGPW